MHVTRRRCLVALLYLGVALTIGAAPLAACDPVWLPVARPDGVSVLVALALAETVLDSITGPIAARTHAFFGRRLDEFSGRPRGGQRVRVLRSADDDAPMQREAVLVPWAYRQDCRPIEWTGKLDWIQPGTRGVVTGWLRPREHWLAGLPTYDVEMAWREPLWVENDSRWALSGTDDVRMTPEDFLDFYAALPTEAELDRSPRDVADRLRRWEQGHPALATRVPAPTLLHHVNLAARARLRPSLAGRWLVQVELLESNELPLPVTARKLSGELELRPVPLAPDAATGAPTSVYVGTSTLDFSPLGFRLGSTEVLASIENTGVRIILDPNVDHGHVAVTVTGESDELVGTWYLNSRPARAHGRIVLSRLRG
jgi:hypothetical protein